MTFEDTESGAESSSSSSIEPRSSISSDEISPKTPQEMTFVIRPSPRNAAVRKEYLMTRFYRLFMSTVHLNEYAAAWNSLRIKNIDQPIRPLVDIRTGRLIPDQPKTINDFMYLSDEAANKVLLALGYDQWSLDHLDTDHKVWFMERAYGLTLYLGQVL